MAVQLLPPTNVQGMLVLDKSAFTKSFLISALRVDALHCNKMRKALSRILLRKPRMKDIVADPLDSKKKLLLFDSKLNTMDGFKKEEQDMIKEHKGELINHKIICTYEHYTADEILNAVLPEDMEVTTSFETIGHIAHMNLRECQLQFKELIGQVILDKNPNIRTVVNKTNTIEETFRFFKMELLAGENNMFACVKQHGCKFEFDFSKVYWNSRLQTEHQRIIDILKEGDVVCDAFAGVGPFAIPAAKKGCKVYANDLNPESYKALQHNVTINSVTGHVFTYNSDGRDFLRNIFGLNHISLHDGNQICNISHVIMNLPAIATEFLDVFKDIDAVDCRKGMFIHCYCFSTTHSKDPYKDAEDRVRQMLGPKVGNCNVHMVRNVAPKKVMMCVSFELLDTHRDKQRMNLEEGGVQKTDNQPQKRGVKRPAED